MTLAERLRAKLSATASDPIPLTGDVAAAEAVARRTAAVLVAITDRPEPGLILTQRPDTMRNHAGQVAFPGGGVDPGDADAVATALREAQEEVALPPPTVDVLGTLPPYYTTTGFAITPVIGVVPPDLPLVPAEGEVAAVFEVPLAFALDAPNWVQQRAFYKGFDRHYYEAWHGEYRIWGVTAALLVNVAARLA